MNKKILLLLATMFLLVGCEKNNAEGEGHKPNNLLPSYRYFSLLNISDGTVVDTDNFEESYTVTYSSFNDVSMYSESAYNFLKYSFCELKDNTLTYYSTRCATVDGNPLALKYFWQKSSKEFTVFNGRYFDHQMHEYIFDENTFICTDSTISVYYYSLKYAEENNGQVIVKSLKSILIDRYGLHN